MKHLTLAALSAICLASPVLAEDLTFVLNNQSSAAITEFYTSPTDVDNWEEDVIASGSIASGEQSEITISDGREQCAYDLRIVFEDGSEITDTADMCALEQYDVTDN